MALIRWDPLGDMGAMHDRMNRLLADLRVRPAWGGEEINREAWVPPVDIYETADSIVLQAELPGISKEDINLEVKDNTLTIKGEKKFEKEVKEDYYFRVERAYGSFRRAFTLPSVVVHDKVKAEFKDGVLVIQLPKAEEAKPKQIKVDMG
jgi:HSP20 family protein